MSDDLTSALDQIRAIIAAATPGPWEAEESDDCWQLFGAITPNLHPLQLIKAPKHGTPYAEYWPNEADAKFIVMARSTFPVLLAAVEAVLKLADESEPVDRDYGGEPIWWSLTPAEIREAIRAALTGDKPAR